LNTELCAADAISCAKRFPASRSASSASRGARRSAPSTRPEGPGRNPAGSGSPSFQPPVGSCKAPRRARRLARQAIAIATFAAPAEALRAEPVRDTELHHAREGGAKLRELSGDVAAVGAQAEPESIAAQLPEPELAAVARGREHHARASGRFDPHSAASSGRM
jgi:hypothetical protein